MKHILQMGQHCCTQQTTIRSTESGVEMGQVYATARVICLTKTDKTTTLDYWTGDETSVAAGDWSWTQPGRDWIRLFRCPGGFTAVVGGNWWTHGPGEQSVDMDHQMDMLWVYEPVCLSQQDCSSWFYTQRWRTILKMSLVLTNQSELFTWQQVR